MRAVNLIPAEARRGGSAPGRTGNAVYVVLGALGVLLIALTAWVLANNSIKDRQAKLVSLTNEAGVAENQAAALKPYSDFAQLRQARLATVAQLAGSRFDWERAMRQLARVLPGNVWLTSFVGTVKPGVSFSGGGAGGSDTSSVRGDLPVPAVELVGCTDTQAEVARVIARLRQMENVTRVTLVSSEKSDSSNGGGGAPASGDASSGGGGGAGDTDCRHGSDRFPQFSLVVFFRELPGADGSSSLPGQATATGAAAQAQATASASQAPPAAQTGASTSGGAK